MCVALRKDYLIVAVVCGVGALASQVEAQSTPALDQSAKRVVSALVDTNSAKGEKLRSRGCNACKALSP
jgi:hypothetical protein